MVMEHKICSFKRFQKKIKEARLKFSQGSLTVLQKMANYQEVSETNKYTIKQIKICSKKKTEKILKLNENNFQDDEWPHKLFLTTR